MLNLEPPPRNRAVTVFHRDGRPRELIRTTAFDKLSLLPADESLRELPLQLARIGNARRLATLCGYFKNDYRRIVLDCPPMMNEVSEQIIAAADVMLLPLAPSPLARRSFEQVRAELARHGRHPPLLPVLSMYDVRRTLHRNVRETVAVGWPVIPASSWVEQAAQRRLPIALFANWSEPSRALGRLWTAVESKLLELNCS